MIMYVVSALLCLCPCRACGVPDTNSPTPPRQEGVPTVHDRGARRRELRHPLQERFHVTSRFQRVLKHYMCLSIAGLREFAEDKEATATAQKQVAEANDKAAKQDGAKICPPAKPQLKKGAHRHESKGTKKKVMLSADAQASLLSMSRRRSFDMKDRYALFCCPPC